MQLQLPQRQGAPQVGFQRATRPGGDVHGRLKESPGAAAFLLGAIKREIGILHQLHGMCAVARRHRDTNAGADAHLVAIQHKRLIDALDNAAGDRRWFPSRP